MNRLDGQKSSSYFLLDDSREVNDSGALTGGTIGNLSCDSIVKEFVGLHLGAVTNATPAN